MSLKKMLSAILALALVLSTMGTLVFAADTDIIEVGAGKTHETWSAAVAAASDADKDGAITYHIYGKVEVDKTGWVSPRGTSGATTINFVGKTEDAEISIAASKGTIIATNGVADMAAINYADLTLSRPNGSWVGDMGHANNYFTTWMRGANNGVVTYTNCVFPNGSCNNQYAETGYTNCTFNNPKEYALWIYGGEVSVTGSTFQAAKGIQAYSEGNAVITTTISDCTFDIEKKPAVVSASKGTMTLKNIDVTACEYGLLETKGKDGKASNGIATITVDGETPTYVATVDGKLYTNLAYAEAEAGDKTIETPVAIVVGNTTSSYTSLAEALSDAGKAGAGDSTVEILSDIDLSKVDWKPVSVDGYHGAGVVTVEGNGHTITGLNAPLFAGGFAGESGIVIKDLTIQDSEIVSDNDQGSGAFIECTDSMETVTLQNCHLLDSTVTGSRTGGLIGWTSGYSKLDDGPVKSYVTITDCSVKGCTITGTAVGAINGHAGASDWTWTAIEDCTIENNTIISTDDGSWRAGVVVGTANIGTLEINDITESNNTVTQTDKTMPEGQTTLVGRFVPSSSGKLVIDGIPYDETCKTFPVVIGKEGYATFKEAVDAAQGGDTIKLLADAELTEAVEFDAAVTVDLNGFTLTMTAEPATFGPELRKCCYYINEDVSFKNGTMNVSNETEMWHGVFFVEVNDALTFDHVELSSDGFAGYSFIQAYGPVNYLNGTVVDIANGTGVFMYSEEFLSTVTMDDSQIKLNNLGGGITSGGIVLDAENVEITITNITGSAFENVKGRLRDTQLTVDGAEYGIKNNSLDAVLTVTDSTVSIINVKNPAAEPKPENVGIYLAKRENLADTDSLIYATVYAEGGKAYNTLIFEVNGGSVIEPMVKEKDEVVDLSEYEPVKEGFEFGGWYADEALKQKVTEVTLDSCKTIYAKWDEIGRGGSLSGIPGGTGSAITQYTVTFQTDGGNALSSVTQVRNSKLDLSGYIPEKEGYLFEGWYTDAELTNPVDEVSVSADMTLYAKWTEATEEPADTEASGFADLDGEAWYYEAVNTAIENGLMNGMSETEFAPNMNLTRGMFVTILYRTEGAPAAEGESRFADVAANQYYTDAVLWATANGIVNGITETTFAPGENITREQMAAIISRYLAYKKIEVADGGEVAYTDEAEIAAYALDAVKETKWAGLLEGNADGSFAPKRNTTRAEAAALFVRLMNLLLNI